MRYELIVGAQVLHSIARTLKAGAGRVLVRDYAEGDLAESRLAASSRQQKLQDSFYVRGDGTRAFYFSQEGLRKLLSEAGYSCEKMHVHERTIENRRKGLLMDRRWIQAVFRLGGTAPLPSTASGTPVYPDHESQRIHERPSAACSPAEQLRPAPTAIIVVVSV